MTMVMWFIVGWLGLGSLTGVAYFREELQQGTWESGYWGIISLIAGVLICVGLGPIGAFLWLTGED